MNLSTLPFCHLLAASIAARTVPVASPLAPSTAHFSRSSLDEPLKKVKQNMSQSLPTALRINPILPPYHLTGMSATQTAPPYPPQMLDKVVPSEAYTWTPRSPCELCPLQTHQWKVPAPHHEFHLPRLWILAAAPQGSHHGGPHFTDGKTEGPRGEKIVTCWFWSCGSRQMPRQH